MEKKIKTIRNIIIVIVSIIIIAITYTFFYNSNKTKRIINILKKEKYEDISNNEYYKKINNNNSTIEYSYNTNENTFSKYISKIENQTRQKINLIYNGKKIEIYYDYQDTKGCRLTQEATYNFKNYKCEVLSNNGNCNSKCDIMLKEAKEFYKEQKELFK